MQTSVSAVQALRVIRERSNKRKTPAGATLSWQISVANKNAHELWMDPEKKDTKRTVV